MILLLTAFDKELDAFQKYFEDLQVDHWYDYQLLHGNLFDKEVIATKTGVGKVHAALVCQHLIDEYKPSTVIFTGLAGSLNPELIQGDVIIGKDLVQHDFVAHPKFPKYHIPKNNRIETFHTFSADSKLVEKASEFFSENHKTQVGRILTGDQFIGEKSDKYSYLTDDLHGDAIEMEGASVAQVCTINQVPFVVIRTISDNADKSAHIDFEDFIPVATKNSVDIVKFLLKSL